jgi:hypothetical protein
VCGLGFRAIQAGTKPVPMGLQEFSADVALLLEQEEDAFGVGTLNHSKENAAMVQTDLTVA